VCSGTAETNATVQIRNAAGVLIGSGVADADGNYAIDLDTPLENGETVTVTQVDAAGNVSPPAVAIAPDLTAPDAPSVALETATSLTGTGEPGAIINVYDSAGTVLGTGHVGGDGSFTIALSPPQNNGERLTVSQTDGAGNVSDPVFVTAADGTAPQAPIAVIGNDGLSVTGTGEPGATIRIYNAARLLVGTAVVQGNGTYAATLDIPQTNGEALTVTQADAAGNESTPTAIVAPDLDAPAAPGASISGNGATVSGSGEPGAIVEVRDALGTLLGSDIVRPDGSYSVTLSPPLVEGEPLSVTQIDAAGNVSDPTAISAPDLTAPAAPSATIATDGSSISGTGEVGATIIVRDASGAIIGTTRVGDDGNYSVDLDPARVDGEVLDVTQSDAAGNESAVIPVTAPDLTAPPAPVATIDGTGTVVTGMGVAGSTVEVRAADGTLLGNGVVDAQGNYTVTLTTPQVDSEPLNVTQADPAGNISNPTGITAPDLTPPAAPVATIAADGSSISGTGEVGATITVRDASGAIVGTTVVDDDGNYLFPLSPARVDGEVLSITQSDVAGNVSTGVTVTADDTTPPPAPSATIDGTGTVVTGSVVTGSGVAGSTIEVRAADGTLLGSGVVDAQGNYTVTLNAPQVDGEALAVTQVDPSGNISNPTGITAPDLTPPAAPVATIAADGSSISGTGEVGATITVRDASGAIIGTTVVDDDGNYLFPLSPARVDGEVLSITQSDVAGNVSTGVTVTADDTTPPPAPSATIDGTGTVVTGSVVTGSGVAGSTIEVRAADGTLLGSGVVDAQGNYTVTLNAPQVDGESLAVTQVDPSGNISNPTGITAPDLTPPAAPVATIAADGSSISGTGEVGATITVRDASGAIVGTTVVDDDGNYLFPLSPARVDGEVLSITQSDVAGNVSTGVTVTADDTTPPPAPSATIDGTGTVVTGSVVTGSGVAGSTIEVRAADGTLLGSGVVDAQGNYTVTLNAPQVDGESLAVTQVDPSGNISNPTGITAPDLTPPAAPVATIAADGSSISGTGEVGATITVRDASGAIVGTTVVDDDGNYLFPLSPARVDGEVFSITQSDVAGNVSTGVTVTADDTTPPPAPTAAIDDTGRIVTGTGVAGSAVEVRTAGGTLLGTGIVNAQGNYSVVLTPPQLDSEPLRVTQADGSGNISDPANVTAPDLTAPEPPTANIAGDGASMSGTGEIGATIIVTDPTGREIGTAIVDGSGFWSALLTSPQVHGEPLTVVQSDAAGNVSDELPVTAPNLNGPDAPDPVTATISPTGDTVSGTGEIGATVTVTGPGGLALGSTIVDGDGNYSITLGTPQANGEKLVVVQTDTDGNSSVPVILTAPDITPPLAPTAQIDATGAVVTGSGEKGATITVRDADGTVIGTATVDGQGHYAAALTTPQTDGSPLNVTQTDAAGNESGPTAIATPDLEAPAAPTGTVELDGSAVTGTGEAGATITVTDANGVSLGSVTVDNDGNFSVPLNPALTNGEPLTLVQTDAAGNASITVDIAAPDITAPDAPTGTVTSDGSAVTGTGEAGATIRITDADGTLLGTTTVGANGAYIVILPTPQLNGETLGIVQTDAAGNASAQADAIAPDVTAPAAPTGTIAPDGTEVTGTGEAGAIISITNAAGTVLGTATVATDGNYSVTLTEPQANGQALTLVQTDGAGNVSPQVPITAPDITAPNAPTGTVSTDGTLVTGTGEAGATISITNAAGTVIGTATVAANGSYAATLATPQLNGETLGITQADAAGNVSVRVPTIAPDVTAPVAPTGTISGDGAVVSGSGEAGATISVTNAAGTVLGTATVAGNGSYSVTLTTPQTNGEALTLIQRDGAGNASPTVPITAPDTTAPTAPTGTVTSDGTTVTGTGEAGATIRITNPGGTVIGTATVGANGSYSATLTTAQVNGETLGVTQTDGAGNVSVRVPTIAPDITAPVAPTGTINGDGAVVSGSGEAGATISVTNAAGTVLGTATVAGNGSYSVTLTTPQTNGEALTLIQRDGAGNASPTVPITAPDTTAPTAPTGTVTSDGTTVTGTGEAGATIRITNPAGTVIGTATVAANGSYSATLTTPQLNGETLGVTQADGAGNVSVRVPTIAPDITAPAAPTGAVTADGTTVNGSGEAGATITITSPAGAIIGTATVAGNGSYSVTLTTPQTNGQTLGITQADAAGNVSPRVPTIAPDSTPPAAPTGTVTADGAVVNGTGEAGATISITNPAGAVIGTATVAGNGSYSVTLTTPQTNGQTLGITQSDAAGNVSPRATTLAPDSTPPAAPTGTITGNGAVVNGTGEAGATIRITNASGTLLGTAVVAANGTYSATLNTPQTNGEKLTLVQSDPAGNVSPVVPITAPDTTAPVAPTAAVSANGGSVTGTGEAGATITVRAADGTILGTATVAANGSYTAALSPAQLNGERLSVSQTDGAGNGSPNAAVTAPDHTPPAAPTAAVSATGTVVTGTGEAGATVTVTNAAGVVIGTALVAANGSYSVTLTQAQANGETIGVVQTDGAGNPSISTSAIAPDITAPNAPANLAVNTAGTTLTGIGEAGATVRVRDGTGTVIGTGQVGSDGRFSVTLSSPQVGGQNLTVTQTDVAGNQSLPGAVGAPFDIAAFDNSTVALIDLLPVSTAVNHGTANYLALVSLGLLNVNAQVLATPSVGFTVADGHSLNAVFTYDATLSIGVLSGYSVAVQRWNGSAWVAVGGGNGASLLQLGLLNGNLVSTETLGPGQYRAFVTFDGTLGVGLLGSLNVAGTDSDFTDIGGIVPQQIQGNVITDPSPDGHIDIISPQTVIQSVTVNGVTTAVNANGTVVNGAFGRLVINLDGSYSYTPSPTAASIGKTDVFQYTLIDRSDGETETANLSIRIGSDDITAAPVANHDTATAAVQYQNVVQTVATASDFSFNTAGAVLVPVTGSSSKSFTVGANSQSDVTITVIRGGSLTVLPSYTITVKNAAGATVGTYTATAVAGLPLGSGITHTFDDLPSGTYTYTVSSTNILGTGYGSTVYIGQSITHLDQYTVSGVTGTQGELLANDVTGTAFPVVKVGTGSGFVEVGETAVTIQGTYGTLTVNETGHYNYTPGTTIPHSTVNLVDSFTYQIVQPNGVTATATLDVTINVGSGATSAFMSFEQASLRMDEAAAVSDDSYQTASLTSDTTTDQAIASAPEARISSFSEEATVSGTDDPTVSGTDLVVAASAADPVDAPSADQPVTPDADPTDTPVSDEVLGELAYQMFEGQGVLEDVLSAYLDRAASPERVDPIDMTTTPTTESVDLTPVDVLQDPLAYLSTSDDIEKHSINNGHTF
jgi:hypothetical protein